VSLNIQQQGKALANLELPTPWSESHVESSVIRNIKHVMRRVTVCLMLSDTKTQTTVNGPYTGSI
jgi:hypothetical protein